MLGKIYTSELCSTDTIIDLRTIEEDAQQIDNAISLPLFTQTDIAYIQKKGYTDKKSVEILLLATKQIEKFVETHPNLSAIILICNDGKWISRFAWDTFRLSKPTLIFKHGIKGLKRWIRKILSSPFEYYILMGPTGVGKTEILTLCKEHHGLQCIDFEELAHHRGSVFGNLQNETQPSPLQFELSIALALQKMDIQQAVLVEHEPGNLGQLAVPAHLYEAILKGKIIALKRDLELRKQALINSYAGKHDDKIKEGILTLKQRLGEEKAISLITALAAKAYHHVAEGLLDYYDQTKQYVPVKNPDFVIEVATVGAAAEEVRLIIVGGAGQKKTPPVRVALLMS